MDKLSAISSYKNKYKIETNFKDKKVIKFSILNELTELFNILRDFFKFINTKLIIRYTINDKKYINTIDSLINNNIYIYRIIEILNEDYYYFLIDNINLLIDGILNIRIYPEFDIRIDNIVKNILYGIYKITNKNQLMKNLYENTISNSIILKKKLDINKKIKMIFIQLKKKNLNNNLICEHKYKKNKENKQNLNNNKNTTDKSTINTNNDNNKNNKDINNGHNNEDNNNNHNNNIYTYIYDINDSNNYINYKFVNRVKYKNNIDEKEITKIDVQPDGNCFMRCIALFVYKNENLHIMIREKIVKYIEEHKIMFQHLQLETEIGLLNFNEYLNYIKTSQAWSGEIEKYAAEEIFNINIGDYIEEVNNHNQVFHKFFSDSNHDNNYNKDLCLLTNISNSHYNLLFDKNYNCFKNEKSLLIFLYNNNNQFIKNDTLLKISILNNKNHINNKLSKNNENIKNKDNKKEKCNIKNIIIEKYNNNISVDSEDSEKSSCSYKNDDEIDIDNLEYNNENIELFNYKKYLFNIDNKNYEEILNLYKEANKTTKYSDIYKYLHSIKDNNSKRE